VPDGRPDGLPYRKGERETFEMERERRILHLDMDAYFASLETQACPSLQGKPLVVGALPGSRGVVASASYEAREYGIRAGMPVAVARRLCPKAEFVPCHPALYIHTTRHLLKHLLGLTSQVEMFSIDEAYLDITDLLGCAPEDPTSWKAVASIARDLAGSIERAFGLSASVGAGPNKLIAKMSSEVKKPHGVTLLGYEGFRHHFWSKPVEALYGVGEKTGSSLMILGIETIGELAETPASFLARRFGVFGEALHAMAWGHDQTPVVPSHDAPPAKSLGHEHTVVRDLETLEEGLSLILSLAERVGEDLRREEYAGRRVTLRIRYSDFSTLMRQKMISSPTHETRDIYRTAKELFLTNYCGGGMRLLGLTVGELMKTDGRIQLGLFPEDRRYRELLETVDRIRETYGHESILPAGALREPPPRAERYAAGETGGEDEPGLESRRRAPAAASLASGSPT
jgi:DNA polymerase-4